MKKRIVLLGWVLAVSLAGCGRQPQGSSVSPVPIGVQTQEQTAAPVSGEGEPQKQTIAPVAGGGKPETGETESANSVQGDVVAFGEKKIVEGYQLADGSEVPVTATFWIESVLRGEEAYELLSGNNGDLDRPEQGMEYVVVQVGVTYEKGDSEYLNLSENHASLASASLYFAMSDEESNARQVTEMAENPVYDIMVARQETATGQVAFLHKEAGEEYLAFTGYNNVVQFSLK